MSGEIGKFSRRGLLAAGSLALAGGATVSAASAGAPREIVSAFAIHQVEDFAAEPGRIYGALLDGTQFAAFSGRPATIDGSAGGLFSLFGGLIVGRNIELEKEVRIVQAWRAADWDKGSYSIARFELAPRDSGARVTFDHTGFPPGLAEARHLLRGWNEHYWGPLRKYLG
jgi:activator of HSP90 ATPase